MGIQCSKRGQTSSQNFRQNVQLSRVVLESPRFLVRTCFTGCDSSCQTSTCFEQAATHIPQPEQLSSSQTSVSKRFTIQSSLFSKPAENNAIHLFHRNVDTDGHASTICHLAFDLVLEI